MHFLVVSYGVSQTVRGVDIAETVLTGRMSCDDALGSLFQANLSRDISQIPDAADVEFRPGTPSFQNLFQLLLLLTQIPIRRGPRIRKAYLHQDRRSFRKETGNRHLGFPAR
jgi:hypothetical protein